MSSRGARVVGPGSGPSWRAVSTLQGRGSPEPAPRRGLRPGVPAFWSFPSTEAGGEGLGPILVFSFVTSRKVTAHASARNPFCKSSSGNARGCRTASETPGGNPEHPRRVLHCSSRDPAHTAQGTRRQEACGDLAVYFSTCWVVAWGGVGGGGPLRK